MIERIEAKDMGFYDLIVCGGGVAGIAAAVSARRSGLAKVLLIEKLINLGGLATCGLISWFEPICDGRGNQFVYGLGEEMFDLSIRYGPDKLPKVWGSNKITGKDPRYATFFSPTMFSLCLDFWLEENGVEVLLDTVVSEPLMGDGRCEGVFVENKSGRSFYGSKAVIDATGDLDVMCRAGVPTVEGQNYLSYIAYVCDKASCAHASESDNMLDARRWVLAGSDLWGNGHPNTLPRFPGTTAEDVTRFVRAGRRLLFDKVKAENKNGMDISNLPSMAQFRTTRRLDGKVTLYEKDMGRRFDESIGRVGDFLKRGHLYEIPYGTLFHQDFGNLFTAGRTISSAGWAWEVTRVIPACIVTGQAAGCASAICVKQDVSARDIDINILQENLRDSGVHIHIDDL